MLSRLREPRSTSTHLIDGRPTPASDRNRPGGLLGVTGSPGAPGRTFLSINLAYGFSAEGLSVVLVDADPHLGAIAVQLDLAEDRSLMYLAHEATLKTVDDDLISRHIQSSAGVDVLVGRTVPGIGDVISGSLIRDVLTRLRRRYDVVIVDVGALDCVAAQTTALMCQLLVWVVVPTKLGTDLLDRTLAGSLASPARTRPSLVVLNKLGNLSLRDVDASLRRRYGIAVAAAIGQNRRACVEAEDGARPAVLAGALARPLRRCARVVALALAKTSANSQPAAEGFPQSTGVQMVREDSL
jgi:MinD-like ATPase involved in chromosome partitioning or flagellar assembly